MIKLMEVLTAIGAAIGALILFLTLTGSQGPPQEAAGAAIAVAFAVIPYCVTAMLQRAAILRRAG